MSYRGVKPEAKEKPFLRNFAEKSMGLSPQKGPLVPWFISGQTIPNPVNLSAGTAQFPGGLGFLDLPMGNGGRAVVFVPGGDCPFLIALSSAG